MSRRREFMGYVGTGSIGLMAGYYLGARKLLGLQSEQAASDGSEQNSTEEVDTATNERTTDDTETPDDTSSGEVSIYDDFENGELTNPSWEIVGLGSGGLRPENEIGIAESGHDSEYSMYLDHGGSISNFGAESTLNQVVSPEVFSFYLRPTSVDRYSKNRLRLFKGDTQCIGVDNHIRDDKIYINGPDDKFEVRDGAITQDVDQFIEVTLKGISWDDNEIDEVYVDGEREVTGAPFASPASGFDRLFVVATGGEKTAFQIDDIGWG